MNYMIVTDNEVDIFLENLSKNEEKNEKIIEKIKKNQEKSKNKNPKIKKILFFNIFYCSACNSKVSKKDIYCKHCGQRLMPKKYEIVEE